MFVNCYELAAVCCRVFLKLFGRLWIHMSTRRSAIPSDDFFCATSEMPGWDFSRPWPLLSVSFRVRHSCLIRRCCAIQ